MDLKLIRNDPLYADLARDFVVMYIAQIARLLHGNPNVEFDLSDVTPAANDLLFELCFLGIVRFEDRGGYERGAATYFPRAAFDRGTRSTVEETIVGQTPIHGLIEDDTLAEGIALAQSD